MDSWERLLKLDPDRAHTEAMLDQACKAPVDALILGGTWGVTTRNATDLALALRARKVRRPIWQEVSSDNGIAFGVDGYLFPIVLNALDIDVFARSYVKALRLYRSVIPWNKCESIGYVVMNEACAVARRARAEIPRDLEDVLAYAAYGTRLCGMKALYLEYSGTLGDVRVLQSVKRAFPHIHLVYGGGIETLEQMEIMKRFADTVVVGNVLYEKGLTRFLKATCTT